MMPIKIREAVVVEGKYDVQRLRGVVETTVVETGGFRLFKDSAKLTLLRRLAQNDGLIILTDSDAAGFVIRDRISGALPTEQVKHAYVPEIFGKERRKTALSAEGLLGVEGMENEVILQALLRAGATVTDSAEVSLPPPFLTKVRLYEDGLVGGSGSALLRKRLLAMLGLPHYLSANRLLEVLNAVLTPEEYNTCLEQLKGNSDR